MVSEVETSLRASFPVSVQMFKKAIDEIMKHKIKPEKINETEKKKRKVKNKIKNESETEENCTVQKFIYGLSTTCHIYYMISQCAQGNDEHPEAVTHTAQRSILFET